MTRTTTFLTVGLAALAAALPLAAHAKPTTPDAPAGIQPPDGHRPYLTAHAVGVQIYGCNGTSWSLIAPRADLYGDNGQLIATHFAGPSWQAKDGSKVMARRAADPVTVDPTAIPWLLLESTSATAGSDGDRLAGTTYIQRIDTTGGLAPAAADCNAATAGDQAEVDYTADYVFWKKRS
jgi:hypothetical protein